MPPRLVLDERGVEGEEKVVSILRCYDDGIRDFIQKVQDKDITVFLGLLKSGKSTVVSGLLGDQLLSFKEAGKPIKIKKLGTGVGPAIGSEGIAACTLCPGVYTVEGLGLVVDMPGFDDNRVNSYQDVINAMFIREVLLVARKVRFAVVVDYDGLVQADAARFIDTMETLCNMIPNIQDPITQNRIIPSLSIVFTCCPSDVNSEVISRIINTDIINGNLDVPAGTKAMSQIITSHPDKIAIFSRPDIGGQRINGIGNVLEVIGRDGNSQYIAAQDLGEINIPFALKSERVLCDLYDKICLMMTKIIKGIANVYDDIIKDANDEDQQMQEIKDRVSTCTQAVDWANMIQALIPEELSARIVVKEKVVDFFDKTPLPGKTKMSVTLQMHVKTAARIIEDKISRKELSQYGENLNLEEEIHRLEDAAKTKSDEIKNLEKILNPNGIEEWFATIVDRCEAGWDGIRDVVLSVTCSNREYVSLVAPTGSGIGGAILAFFVTTGMLPVLGGLVVGGTAGVGYCGVRKMVMRNDVIATQLETKERPSLKEIEEGLRWAETELMQTKSKICSLLRIEENDTHRVRDILNQKLGHYDEEIASHARELANLSRNSSMFDWDLI